MSFSWAGSRPVISISVVLVQAVRRRIHDAMYL
jgi:hypothetical protein